MNIYFPTTRRLLALTLMFAASCLALILGNQSEVSLLMQLGWIGLSSGVAYLAFGAFLHEIEKRKFLYPGFGWLLFLGFLWFAAGAYDKYEVNAIMFNLNSGSAIALFILLCHLLFHKS